MTNKLSYLGTKYVDWGIGYSLVYMMMTPDWGFLHGQTWEWWGVLAMWSLFGVCFTQTTCHQWNKDSCRWWTWAALFLCSPYKTGLQVWGPGLTFWCCTNQSLRGSKKDIAFMVFFFPSFPSFLPFILSFLSAFPPPFSCLFSSLFSLILNQISLGKLQNLTRRMYFSLWSLR